MWNNLDPGQSWQNVWPDLYTNCLTETFQGTYVCILQQLSHDTTKPTKWVCAERRLRSAWAYTQSDQSLCCALMIIWQWVTYLESSFLHADSKDPDQTELMPRLLMQSRCLGWSESLIHFCIAGFLMSQLFNYLPNHHCSKRQILRHLSKFSRKKIRYDISWESSASRRFSLKYHALLAVSEKKAQWLSGRVEWLQVTASPA